MIEPVVLAEAKDYLTSNSTDIGYTVVDSQFLVDTWGDIEIPEETIDRLSPINSLRLAGGRPDALVASPNPNSYETSTQQVLTPLLAVIEAKGYSGKSVDVAEAITQAHNHLDEVNLGFAAVPESSVKPIHCRLAGELNVGIIVASDDGTSVIEKPRAVGASTTPSTETIRFHARIGGNVPSKLKKNHPKNALGYALTVAADGDPDQLCSEYVIRTVSHARLDAEALGLIVTRSGEPVLTPRGREATRTLSYCYDGIIGALETISSYQRSSKRLIDVEPAMGVIARNAILDYPPTQELLTVLDEIAAEGNEANRVDQVAKRLAERRPEFAIELFLNPDPETRQKAIEEDDFQIEVFDDEQNYHTNTLYQYKAVLWHTGILTSKGIDNLAQLDFTRKKESQMWVLENELKSK